MGHICVCIVIYAQDNSIQFSWYSIYNKNWSIFVAYMSVELLYEHQQLVDDCL